MKTIYFFLGILCLYISCGKENVEELEFSTNEVTEEKIKHVLMSNGISEENIHFSDTLDRSKSLHFSTIEEFEEFVKQGKVKITHQADLEQDGKLFKRWGEPLFFNETRVELLYMTKLYQRRIFNPYFSISGFYDYNHKNGILLRNHVSSNLIGYKLGFSYNEQYINMTPENLIVDGIVVTAPRVRVKGMGTLNYDIFIKNIGTYYTRIVLFDVLFRGRYGTMTNFEMH